MSTVHELVLRFGSHWSETEVEAAVWKLIGDAAAKGRLLVDLTEVELSRGGTTCPAGVRESSHLA